VTGPSSWGLPRDVSLHGWRVDWLLNSTSVFVLIMFGATLVWILWSSFFHGAGHRAHYDVGNARRQTLKALGLSLAIFLVVDGNLFVNGLRDLDRAFWNFEAVEADPRTLRLEINARQWTWDARYAGPDGTFNTRDDIVTVNDIRVPVNTPILLQLAATDVLHSFSLPNFRIKQDAVPGMINRLWFQAKETGRFEIACAQHCGVNHYKMRGLLSVLTPEAYAAWAAEASALSAESFDPADKGAQWGWPWKRPEPDHGPHAGQSDHADHADHRP
jgi:cytochrome c oxidase subunit 2